MTPQILTHFEPIDYATRWHFSLVGRSCTIWQETKDPAGQWAMMAAAPLFTREFTDEVNPAHYKQFRLKFAKEADYRAQFATAPQPAPAEEASELEAPPAAAPALAEVVTIEACHPVGFVVKFELTGNGDLPDRLARRVAWLTANGYTPTAAAVASTVLGTVNQSTVPNTQLPPAAPLPRPRRSPR